jgi:predicted lipoprotein with Yx(FWY)xxD motif
MRTSKNFAIPVLVAAAALAGCGSSSKSSSSSSTAASQPATAPSGEAVVKTAASSKLGGTILVDAHGMTLYSLSGEHAGKFICTSAACVQVWHPLTGATTGASVASLATVKRPDGTEQVTYKGMPLYTFSSDKAPGEVNGQGIKDVGTWRAVISASAASAPAASSEGATTSSAPAPASTTPTTTTPSEGTGRYGY